MSTWTRARSLHWDALADTASAYGNSFYLADVAQFERNCDLFLRSFRSIYPRTSLAYSYKTNYLPAFVHAAHRLGAYAEVVSRNEYDLAAEWGVPGNRIIFNGPIKNRVDLLRAFTAGSMVNVDSLPELWEAVSIAQETDVPIALGIRCWLERGTANSRFGIDLRSSQATDALAALDATSARIDGLHCHYSGTRSVESHSVRAREVVQLHRDILGGRPLKYIDLGGGFTSSVSPELAASLPAPPATPSAYAAGVATEMLTAYGDTGPELIIEPGMGVLGDVMVFATRVEVIKQLGTRRVAVVDGSLFNVKPLRGALNPPVAIVSNPALPPGERARWDIVGHTCMDIDLIHAGYEGAIQSHDFVLVENVGAYTTVLNAPFIRGTPAIVSFSSSGPAELLRAPSTVNHLMRSYELGQ